MEVVEARRLTGRNLQCEGPAAIVEVNFEPGDDGERLIQLWQDHLGELAERVPFALGPTHIRRYPGGAALACAAPIDALYAAVAAVEWAVTTAQAICGTEPHETIEEALPTILAELADERAPAMLLLRDEAMRRGVPFLWDDDEVSLGHGRYARVYSRPHLPEPEDVPWSELRAIPVALITGTNGKTTTARLTARIMRCAGLTVGNSSTDGIYLNEQAMDSGDWTGPGAARAILRHPEVEAAVLETARGGILRRGLGIEQCDVALVTNVAADHLGEYGIVDVPTMAKVKSLVYEAVKPDGLEVVNLDDPNLSRSFNPSRAFLISLNGGKAIDEHVLSGGLAAWFDGSTMMLGHGGLTAPVMDVADIAIARNGRARYNMSNALNAVAVSWALGAKLDAIRSGLAEFGSAWNDNPGRGQLTEVNGVNVLLDFGHNPHGVNAVLEMVNELKPDGGRLSLSFAQAGDRDEGELQELMDVICRFAPDRLFLRDLPEAYWRGRNPDEMYGLFKGFMAQAATAPESLERAPDEVAALDTALNWARPGDLVVHLVHLERVAIEQRLRQLGAAI